MYEFVELLLLKVRAKIFFKALITILINKFCVQVQILTDENLTLHTGLHSTQSCKFTDAYLEAGDTHLLSDTM